MKPEIESDVSTLDGIVHALYEVLSGPAGQPRDWERYRTLFIDCARLIVVVAVTGEKPRARQLTVEDYIRRVEPIFARGLLGAGDQPPDRDLRPRGARAELLRIVAGPERAPF